MIKSPQPSAIRDARKRAQLTQREAAELCLSALRTYTGWENGETAMHPAIFAWFLTCLIERTGHVSK